MTTNRYSVTMSDRIRIRYLEADSAEDAVFAAVGKRMRYCRLESFVPSQALVDFDVAVSMHGGNKCRNIRVIVRKLWV